MGRKRYNTNHKKNLDCKIKKSLDSRIKRARKVRELRGLQNDIAKLDDDRMSHLLHMVTHTAIVIGIPLAIIISFVKPSELSTINNIIKVISSMITNI